MVPVHFPEPGFRLKKEGNTEMIFDQLRKKWLKLTPEEWVRQNFVQYLIRVKEYPATLIALEKQIQLGELRKRFDILVYDREHQPWMMVECKAPDIALEEKVLEQLLRYNISTPVEFLVITNGKQCYAWEKKVNKLEPVTELPSVK